MRAEIVIVTVSGQEHLPAALEAMGAAWRKRTMVIDNGSRDGTGDRVRESFPEVRVQRYESTRGYAAALDPAIRASEAEVVIAANDDVIAVEPAIYDRLAEAFQDPQVGMAGAILLIGDSGAIDTVGVVCDPSLGSHNPEKGRRPPELGGPLEASGTIGPDGGLAAYRRRAYEEVGGFDEAFFIYYEDLDLNLRMREAGWDFRLVPDARARHVGSATLGWRSRRKVGIVGRSRGRLLAKYGVLRRREALPWLLVEVLACLLLTIELRSLVPWRSRLEGYRACELRAPYPDRRLIGQRSPVRAMGARVVRRYGRAPRS